MIEIKLQRMIIYFKSSHVAFYCIVVVVAQCFMQYIVLCIVVAWYTAYILLYYGIIAHTDSAQDLDAMAASLGVSHMARS